MGRSIGHSRFRRRKLKSKKRNKNATKGNVRKTTSKKQKKSRKSKKTELQLIDLNDRCIIKILSFLSINDLVNISTSSPRFKICSWFVFTQNFANNVITVCNETTSAGRLPSELLLSNFGHLIKYLKVKYKDDYYRFNSELDKHIIKYCEKSVTEIKFINLDKFAFDQLKRPFKSVTKVIFTACVVGKLIFQFNKWFPNAQSLDFVESKILSWTDAKCIEKCFPKLQHLGIINPKRADENFNYEFEEANALLFRPIFSNTNLKAAIDVNPQLKSLKLKHNNNDLEHVNYSDECGIKINPRLLGYINEKLPLLDELDLMVSQIDVEAQRERQHVQFNNLRKIRFIFDDAVTLKYYEISTRQPTELILTGDVLNDSCVIFLSKNKQWEKIAFNGRWESSQSFEAVKRKIMKCSILKSLKMSINGLKNKQKEVLSLLNECKFLNNFKIVFSSEPWYKFKEENYYDAEDKRAAEIKLLDALNILRNYEAVRTDSIDDDYVYWNFFIEDESSDIDSDIDTDNDNYFEMLENKLPRRLEKLGKTFLETYQSAFDSKRLNMWQPNYKIEDELYCAIYEKKQD